MLQFPPGRLNFWRQPCRICDGLNFNSWASASLAGQTKITQFELPGSLATLPHKLEQHVSSTNVVVEDCSTRAGLVQEPKCSRSMFQQLDCQWPGRLWVLLLCPLSMRLRDSVCSQLVPAVQDAVFKTAFTLVHDKSSIMFSTAGRRRCTPHCFQCNNVLVASSTCLQAQARVGTSVAAT